MSPSTRWASRSSRSAIFVIILYLHHLRLLCSSRSACPLRAPPWDPVAVPCVDIPGFALVLGGGRVEQVSGAAAAAARHTLIAAAEEHLVGEHRWRAAAAAAAQCQRQRRASPPTCVLTSCGRGATAAACWSVGRSVGRRGAHGAGAVPGGLAVAAGGAGRTGARVHARALPLVHTRLLARGTRRAAVDRAAPLRETLRRRDLRVRARNAMNTMDHTYSNCAMLHTGCVCCAMPVPRSDELREMLLDMGFSPTREQLSQLMAVVRTGTQTNLAGFMEEIEKVLGTSPGARRTGRAASAHTDRAQRPLHSARRTLRSPSPTPSPRRITRSMKAHTIPHVATLVAS